MISPTVLLTWSTLALAVTLAPGPDTLLVASHNARHGLRAGLAVIAGIQLGALWYACLFGLGLLRVSAAKPTTGAMVQRCFRLIRSGAQFF